MHYGWSDNQVLLGEEKGIYAGIRIVTRGGRQIVCLGFGSIIRIIGRGSSTACLCTPPSGKSARWNVVCIVGNGDNKFQNFTCRHSPSWTRNTNGRGLFVSLSLTLPFSSAISASVLEVMSAPLSSTTSFLSAYTIPAGLNAPKRLKVMICSSATTSAVMIFCVPSSFFLVHNSGKGYLFAIHHTCDFLFPQSSIPVGR